MVDILYFERDGIVYAKAFSNQNGFSVYVLPGYEELVRGKVGDGTQDYYLEVTGELPGETSIIGVAR